jgi:hypothetical protein
MQGPGPGCAQPVPGAAEGPLYRVRISVARHGGWRGWAAVRGRFQEHLAAQEGLAVTGPRIEWATQRGMDYVAIAVSMTVRAPDVVQALAAGWEAFRQAVGDDAAGWDMPSAAAEARPEEPDV